MTTVMTAERRTVTDIHLGYVLKAHQFADRLGHMYLSECAGSCFHVMRPAGFIQEAAHQIREHSRVFSRTFP